jgi:hypothetical protein
MRDIIDRFWTLIEDVRVVLGGEDPFEMCNLGPSQPGLPYMIWIGHQGRVRHGPRIAVYLDGYAVKKSMIAISIEENPRVLRLPKQREIPPENIRKLIEFTRKNREILLRYWYEVDMGTGEMLGALVTLEEPSERSSG